MQDLVNTAVYNYESWTQAEKRVALVGLKLASQMQTTSSNKLKHVLEHWVEEAMSGVEGMDFSSTMDKSLPLCLSTSSSNVRRRKRVRNTSVGMTLETRAASLLSGSSKIVTFSEFSPATRSVTFLGTDKHCDASVNFPPSFDFPAGQDSHTFPEEICIGQDSHHRVALLSDRVAKPGA